MTTPRYLPFQVMHGGYSLVVDSLGLQDPIEVRGPNHFAEAGRQAEAMDLEYQLEQEGDEPDVWPWPVDVGVPVG